MPILFLLENIGALSAIFRLYNTSTYCENPSKCIFLKTERSGVLLWGTATETEQSKVDKIKATKTK